MTESRPEPDAARRFLTWQPGTKFTRTDGRVAVRYLWSLLYRAARRNAARVDDARRSLAALARRVGSISTELNTLRVRVDRLERAEAERHRRATRRS